MRSNLLALFAGCVVAVYVTAQSFTPTDVAWMGGTATGEVVAGTFSPDDVAGLIGWWKADSGVYEDAGTDPAEDGDPVYQWNKSVSGMNLLAEGATSRPTYLTGQLNGLPALSFDGGSDYMTNAWGEDKAQPSTLFMVVYVTNISAIRMLVDGIESTKRNAFYYANPAANTFYFGTTDQPTDTHPIQDEWCYLTLFFNQAASYARTNGVNGSVVNATPGNAASSGITVGARYSLSSYFAPMKIAELIWYNADVSLEDVVKVEAYLTNKYGL
jgi:hypothetical protein